MSVKILSLPDSIRDKIINEFVQYTVDAYTIKFIKYRMQIKHHYGEDPESYHLYAEIPNLEEKVKQRATYLFENVNSIIEACATKKARVTFKSPNTDGSNEMNLTHSSSKDI